MAFKLAHLSDVHLAPLQKPTVRELTSKRFYGYQSWLRRRRFIHDRGIADRIVEDIRGSGAHHVALTGDLINIATGAEFLKAADWLDAFGPGNWITVVPGNHDTYVKMPWENGLGLWQAYMTGDMTIPGSGHALDGPVRFPSVRTRRNIALICLNSGVPTAPLIASGILGTRQIEALGPILRLLRNKGFFRVVLIHHPPLPGMNRRRKALLDAAALTDVLREEGSELVLHGHNHEFSWREIASRHGSVHIVGVPSASAHASRTKPQASWHSYQIMRSDGQWHCRLTTRIYDERTKRFEDGDTFALDLTARRAASPAA